MPKYFLEVLTHCLTRNFSRSGSIRKNVASTKYLRNFALLKNGPIAQLDRAPHFKPLIESYQHIRSLYSETAMGRVDSTVSGKPSFISPAGTNGNPEETGIFLVF